MIQNSMNCIYRTTWLFNYLFVSSPVNSHVFKPWQTNRYWSRANSSDHAMPEGRERTRDEDTYCKKEKECSLCRGWQDVARKAKDVVYIDWMTDRCWARIDMFARLLPSCYCCCTCRSLVWNPVVGALRRSTPPLNIHLFCFFLPRRFKRISK